MLKNQQTTNLLVFLRSKINLWPTCPEVKERISSWRRSNSTQKHMKCFTKKCCYAPTDQTSITKLFFTAWAFVIPQESTLKIYLILKKVASSQSNYTNPFKREQAIRSPEWHLIFGTIMLKKVLKV